MICRNAGLLAMALVAALMGTARAASVIISEVNPTGNSNTTYNADWFELTNITSNSVDITGWQVDDNSNGTGKLLLRGITSIPAHASVVFIEGNTSGSNDATVQANFIAAWFGAGNAPAGFLIGGYGGSGVSLSASGDAVNIFDSVANGSGLITRVDFGATVFGTTLDNAAGLDDATISTASSLGVNGAFNSFVTGTPSVEVGSPGAVPEPASLGVLGLAGLALLARRRS